MIRAEHCPQRASAHSRAPEHCNSSARCLLGTMESCLARMRCRGAPQPWCKVPKSIPTFSPFPSLVSKGHQHFLKYRTFILVYICGAHTAGARLGRRSRPKTTVVRLVPLHAPRRAPGRRQGRSARAVGQDDARQQDLRGLGRGLRTHHAAPPKSRGHSRTGHPLGVRWRRVARFLPELARQRACARGSR